MNDTTRTAAVALLAVVAVAVAAASLDAPTVTEGGGPERPTGGNGSDGGGLLPPPPEPATLPGDPLQVPYVVEILSVLALVSAVGFAVYVVVYRREAITVLLAVAALLAALVLLFQLLSAPETPAALGVGDGVLYGEAGSGGDSSTPRPGPPPTALLIVVGIVVAAGALAALFGGTEDDGAPAATTADGVDTDPVAVGRAAGRAADRLDAGTDVDNEVYRTWREMTDLLDVDDPETTTPGEFAAAATAVGLGREDVDELTRLFEDVRYGGADPSADHERRALDVFRRIEARYAEEDP